MEQTTSTKTSAKTQKLEAKKNCKHMMRYDVSTEAFKNIDVNNIYLSKEWLEAHFGGYPRKISIIVQVEEM